MTIKELKMMLNDMPDDAILLTRNALDASEFEQATARGYFGIPQDGYSYDQMKQKYDTYKAAHPAQAQPQYQQPPQEQTQNPNMTYQAPAQSQQPAAPVQPQQPTAPQQPTENQGQ